MSTNIEIILLEEVKGLGKSGQKKQVRLGYARNFLFPNALALMSTEENQKRFDSIKKKEDKRRAVEKAEAQVLSDKVNGKSIVISATAHDNGKLYGSVGIQDIAEKLNSSFSVEIEKKCIVLESPIKEAGKYEIVIDFYPEVQAKVSLEVEASRTAQKSK